MKLGLGVWVLLSACGAPSVEHVAFAPLPPNPTPDQRVAIFNAVRPRATVEESLTTCGRHGCYTTANGALELPDGRIVRDPEDLAPLVAPNSSTLVHAHNATRAASRMAWWGGAAVTALVGGLLLSLHGDGDHNDTEIEIGLGVALGGLLIGAMAEHGERATINNERNAAFNAYPDDLGARLSLCANGQIMLPCEQNAPAYVAPPPPDPGLDQLRPQ